MRRGQQRGRGSGLAAVEKLHSSACVVHTPPPIDRGVGSLVAGLAYLDVRFTLKFGGNMAWKIHISSVKLNLLILSG